MRLSKRGIGILPMKNWDALNRMTRSRVPPVKWVT